MEVTGRSAACVGWSGNGEVRPSPGGCRTRRHEVVFATDAASHSPCVSGLVKQRVGPPQHAVAKAEAGHLLRRPGAAPDPETQPQPGQERLVQPHESGEQRAVAGRQIRGEPY